MRAELVDVSLWQGDIDWVEMAQHVEAGIVKVSQGGWTNKAGTTFKTPFTDSQFLANWVEMEDLAVQRGSYHYYYDPTDPVVQADYYCDLLIDNGVGELLPALDVEQRPMTEARIRACVERIEDRLNVRPLIYTGVSVWNELGGLLWAHKYPLWIAQYPLIYDGEGGHRKIETFEEAKDLSPILPDDWETYSIWQPTDKGPGKEWRAQSHGLDLGLVSGPLSVISHSTQPILPDPPLANWIDPPTEPTDVEVWEAVRTANIRRDGRIDAPVVGSITVGDRVYVVGKVRKDGYTWLDHTGPEQFTAEHGNTNDTGNLLMRKIS